MNTRPNPYVGPRAFSEQNAPFFFGRNREIRSILALLIAERLVLLHSPSGAGKSSLIHAGLIPRLKKERFNILPVVRVNLDLPEELAGVTGINRYVLSTLVSLEEELDASVRTPVQTLAGMTIADYLRQRPRAEGAFDNDLLIFDQFEEVLTAAVSDIQAKHDFFTQLGEAFKDESRWALFAVREDYLGALSAYVRPLPNRLSTTFRLDLLGVQGAMDAIRKPPADPSLGVDFKEEAARALVSNLSRITVQATDATMKEEEGLYIEPVQLQVVCYRLWEKIETTDMQIDTEDIAEIVDVNQSLRDYYADSVKEVAGSEDAKSANVTERDIRDWFGNSLIERHIRRQVVAGDGLPINVASLLVDKHVIRSEKRADKIWFELSHDRMINPVIQDNTRWFEKNLSVFQLRAKLWSEQNRPDSMLLRGLEWVQAEQDAKKLDKLAPHETDFLEACRKERNRAIRNRIVLMAILFLTAISVVSLVINLSQSEKLRQSAINSANLASTNAAIAVAAKTSEAQAITNAAEAAAANDKAQKAKQNAEASEKKANTIAQKALGMYASQVKGQLGILLAMEGYRQSQKNTGISLDPVVISGLRNSLANFGGTPILSYDGYSWYAAFSPDGRWLVSAGASSLNGDKVRLDLTDMQNNNSYKPTQLIQTSEKENLGSFVFSPDSRWLAAISYLTIEGQNTSKNELHLWDLQSQKPIEIVLSKPSLSDIQVTAVALGNPAEGKAGWMAAGYSDGSIYLWNSRNSFSLLKKGIKDVDTGVTSLAFSPDGNWFAAAYGNSRVRFWDTNKLQDEPVELNASYNNIYSLKFSPNSRWLAGDNSLLWDVRNPTQAAYFLQNQGYWWGGSTGVFSADNRWFVTSLASFSGATIQFTDLQNPNKPGKTFNYPDWINTLDISPDSRTLALVDSRAVLHTWRIDDLLNNQNQKGEIPPSFDYYGFEGYISTFAFNPNGEMMAAAGDKQVRLWALPFGTSDPIALQYLQYSPLEKQSSLIVQTDENTILALDLSKDDVDIPVIKQKDKRRPIFYIPNPNFPSQNERYLVTGNEKGFEIWDLQNFSQPSIVSRQAQADEQFTSFTLDPAGRWLAYANYNQIRVEDLSQPAAQPRILKGNREVFDINNLFFAGKWLVSESERERLLWDLSQSDPTPVALQTTAGAQFAYIPTEQHWGIIQEANRNLDLIDLNQPAPQPVSLGKGDPYWLFSGTFQGSPISPKERWLLTSQTSAGKTEYYIYDLQQANPKPISLGDAMPMGLDENEHWLVGQNPEQTALLLWNLQDLSSAPTQVGTNFVGFGFNNQWLVTSETPDDPNSLLVVYHLWNLSGSKPIEAKLPDNPLGQVLFVGSKSRWLVYTDEKSQPKFLDLSAENAAPQIIAEGPYTLQAINSDVTWVIASDANNNWLLFNFETKSKVEVKNGYFYGLSPDEKWAFGVSTDSTQYILVDPATGKEARIFAGKVSSVNFSPDGHWVYDIQGTDVRLWDINDLAANPTVFSPKIKTTQQVYPQVTFLENNKWMLIDYPDSGTYPNNRLYLWRLDINKVAEIACQLVGRNLTYSEWTNSPYSENFEKTCPQWPIENPPAIQPSSTPGPQPTVKPGSLPFPNVATPTPTP